MHRTLRPEPTRLYRWMGLVFLSLAMFGSYYAYDALSPLADVLKQQLGFSDENIGLLQAIYSFPNIFTVVIGGFIIDRLGLRKSLMIFGVLWFIGPAITAASSHLLVLAAGRLIFGMGAESLNVAVVAALARWLKGEELSFAFGVNLTICRLGSFVALNSPAWARAEYANWRWPFLIALGLSAFCIVGAVVYRGMEVQAERNFHLGEASTDKVVCADLFKFGASYWCIVALCITFYSAIFPYQTFAVKFFIEAHGTSREFGGFLSSMLTLFAMIATPLFGLSVDRIGKRALLMMFGSTLLIPIYLMMAYTRVNLHVPMALMGVAFSLIPAVMWPSVRLYRGSIEARNGLRADDHDPEHWPVRLQPDDRMGQRLRPCRPRPPQRLQPRNVDFFCPRISRLELRLPTPTTRARPAWTSLRDHHHDASVTS
jgi:predicted MFS family arabinose efflux permease